MTDDHPAPESSAKPEQALVPMPPWIPRGPIGTWLRAIYYESRGRTRERRARVLADPEIAEGLTQPPIDKDGYPRAKMWNGYVPPRYGPTVWEEPLFDHRSGQPNSHRNRTAAIGENDSPQRHALVVLCAAAFQAATDAGEDIDTTDIMERYPFPLPGLEGKPHPAPIQVTQVRAIESGQDFTEAARSPHNRDDDEPQGGLPW